MKTSHNNPLSRFLMLTLVIAFMFALTGAKPAQAIENQASYIIQASSTDLAASLVTKVGGEITSQLDIIQGVAANLTPSEVANLRSEKDIVAITPNGPVKSSDNSKAGTQSINDSQNNNVPTTDYPDVTGANLVWEKGDIGDKGDRGDRGPQGEPGVSAK